MCEYCKENTDKDIVDKDEWSAGIEPDGTFRAFYTDDWYDFIAKLELKFNYCPMCGRKLGD